MKKTRILEIITKLELGGAQKNLLKTVCGLKDRYDITLATHPQGRLLPEALAIPGISIRCIPSLVRPISPVLDFLAFLSLYRLIKREKFDIVHTHSSKAGIIGRWAARLAGVKKIIHTIHGFPFHDGQFWLKRGIYVFWERITATITNCLVAVSREIVKKGLRSGIGRPRQYRVIYYSVRKKDFGRKPKDEAKQVLRLSGKVVGTVSCFKKQKALPDFLRAASLLKKEHPGLSFLVVGWGRRHKALFRLARRLDIEKEVVFVGWRDDVSDLLAAMDVFVLSSLWEGMPRAILEAMASGLPVVATAVDGTREIVKPGQNGILVNPGDYKGLFQAVHSLLKDEKLACKLGQRGRELIDSGPFHKSLMLSGIIDLYQGLTVNPTPVV